MLRQGHMKGRQHVREARLYGRYYGWLHERSLQQGKKSKQSTIDPGPYARNDSAIETPGVGGLVLSMWTQGLVSKAAGCPLKRRTLM